MIEKILERLEEQKEAYSDTTYYVYGLEAAKKIVQEVAKDGGWIPCSERLPKKSGKYIVTQKRYAIDDRTHKRPIAVEVDYVEFNSKDGEWQRANFFEVIAWQPLPAPYQKGE